MAVTELKAYQREGPRGHSDEAVVRSKPLEVAQRWSDGSYLSDSLARPSWLPTPSELLRLIASMAHDGSAIGKLPGLCSDWPYKIVKLGDGTSDSAE